MCRIFGFRSVINSQVHSSLVGAENALSRQSALHPDGWGVAYYTGGAPHLIRTESSAFRDQLFKRISGIVSSQTVLAHVRRATQGSLSLLNSHPFQYGTWVFAHNGNIKGFDQLKAALLQCVTPHLRRFILGETDSEVLFFMLLTQISRRQALEQPGDIQKVSEAIRETVEEVEKLAGPIQETASEPRKKNNRDAPAGSEENYLTFVLTDGRMMIGHHGGKELYFSTHKKRCPDRDTCSSFAPVCETVATDGPVNHLILTSEPLQGENIWSPLKTYEMIGVDATMRLKRF